MSILERLIKKFYLPTQSKLARQIGCQVIFNHIPDQYIPAIIRCDMTKTWKQAGLDIVKGQNHFTIGNVIDEKSSRFDSDSLLYQSWVGGYSVRLDPNSRPWKVEDYCNLAIADQNSWLHWYGDPSPFTTVEGWRYKQIGKIKLRSGNVGKLYEGGFVSHSDVGPNINTLRFYYASHCLAGLFNVENPELALRPRVFAPGGSDYPYHEITGRVYLGIFDLHPNIKVVLYANGIFRKSSLNDTFEVLKEEFLTTMKDCEIIVDPLS